jgi:hypothetical protein
MYSFTLYRLSASASVLSPVDAFVLMEEAGARELCAYINSALQSVKRVVHGTALLTPAIQATGGTLIAGKVRV